MQNIIREFFFVMVENTPALDEYLCNNYEWDKMKSITYRAMDSIREILNSNYSESDESTIWHAAETTARNACGALLKISPRFLKCSSTSYIYNMTSSMDAEPMDPTTSDEIKTIVRTFYPIVSRRNRGPFSYAWLTWKFGLSTKIYDKLHRAEMLFTQETKRTVLGNMIDEIHDNHPQDFSLIKTFFDEIKAAECIQIYTLPKHFKEQQENAFRQMLGMSDGEELDPRIGTYFYCRNCATIKAYVTMHGDNNHLNSSSRCCNDIWYNMYSGQSYCHNVNDRRCAKEPLICVNLIGKCLSTINNGNVVICPQCCQLTTLQRVGYHNEEGLFSCGCITITQCARKCGYCYVPHSHTRENNLRIFACFDDLDSFRIGNIFLCLKCIKNRRISHETIYPLSELTRILQGRSRVVSVGNEHIVINN